MAGPRLELRLKQQLRMAPQLQQAIKLLQMNRLELRQQVQLIVEANPLLERQELAEDNWEELDNNETQESAESTETEAADDYSDDFDDWEIPDGFSVTGGTGDGFNQENIGGPEESLQDHLLWQINLSPLSETDQAIAEAIVFALDEDGYLKDTTDDIRASLAPELLVETDEIEAVLHRIQRMEPVGVATRTPQDCLIAQLDTMPLDTPHRETARRLARHHLDHLYRGERETIRKSLNITEENLDLALELIQTLEPRPGARFANRKDEFLAPDVYIREQDDEWLVSLNPENQPRLTLNGYYMKLMKSSKGEDASYLRGRLQEARWLLSSLELRNRTLTRVTQAIVERQADYLREGDRAMKPLILKDIAVATGLHESTISRATTRKYALSPQGLTELKYFFSSHVRTLDGVPISATAVKWHVQDVISQEDPKAPLSDQSISDELRERGIRVARRTVSKYRESLGIGSSTDRRLAARRQDAFSVR